MSAAPGGTCTVSQNVPSGLTVSIDFIWLNVRAKYLIQTMLYHFKWIMALWKWPKCPQYIQQTWWQTVATQHTGWAQLSAHHTIPISVAVSTPITIPPYRTISNRLPQQAHTHESADTHSPCSEGSCIYHTIDEFITQIPQCSSPITPNAEFCYRNVHVSTFLLQNAALWDVCLMHCGICEMGLYHTMRYHFIPHTTHPFIIQWWSR